MSSFSQFLCNNSACYLHSILTISYDMFVYRLPDLDIVPISSLSGLALHGPLLSQVPEIDPDSGMVIFSRYMHNMEYKSSFCPL